MPDKNIFGLSPLPKLSPFPVRFSGESKEVTLTEDNIVSGDEEFGFAAEMFANTKTPSEAQGLINLMQASPKDLLNTKAHSFLEANKATPSKPDATSVNRDKKPVEKPTKSDIGLVPSHENTLFDILSSNISEVTGAAPSLLPESDIATVPLGEVGLSPSEELARGFESFQNKINH